MNYLLVHGAGENPSVWEGWDGQAIDLQAGLNVAEASMLNYEAAVTCDAELLPRPLCVVARGMGALAALMAERRIGPDALVLIAPWRTADQAGHEQVEPAGPRPESALALAECRRGIRVGPVSARTLVVEEPADPYAVAAWARSDSASST